MNVIGRIKTRTEKFQSSFYPHCIYEWNELDPEIRHSQSVAIFKAKLLSMIRLTAKSIFDIYGPIGISCLTQLRAGLSKLNLHKFNRNFKDTSTPMCPTNDGVEDTEHYLLIYPSFDSQQQDVLAGASAVSQPFLI